MVSDSYILAEAFTFFPSLRCRQGEILLFYIATGFICLYLGIILIDPVLIHSVMHGD